MVVASMVSAPAAHSTDQLQHSGDSCLWGDMRGDVSGGGGKTTVEMATLSLWMRNSDSCAETGYRIASQLQIVSWLIDRDKKLTHLIPWESCQTGIGRA